MDSNNKNSDRQRLDNLIAGRTSGGRLADSELSPFFKNKKNTPLIVMIAAWTVFLLYYAYINFSVPEITTTSFNPVSKIILKAKSTDFMEENYADFEKDMEIDINTGMIKNKNGYTVTCKDKNNQASKVVIYFDRKFEILNHRPQIIAAQPDSGE